MRLDIRNLRKLTPWDAEHVLWWAENNPDLDWAPAKVRSRIRRRVNELWEALFGEPESERAEQ